MARKLSKQEDRRIGYIDALKGFAILCVVLGHIAGGYLTRGEYPEASGLLHNMHNLIYSFHMPIFMMLSGYLYYTVYFNDGGRPDRERIHRQIYNYISVYVIYSMLWGFLKILAATFAGVLMQEEITLLDVALIWLIPVDVYWYLYVLIFLYLIFSIRWLTEANRWILLVIFAVVAISGKVVDIPWFYISGTMYHALFFFIGMAGKKYKNWIIGNKYLTLVLFAAAVGKGVLVWNRERYTLKILLGIVTALGISLALWYVFQQINFIGNIKILKLCGRHSLEIYVIHNIIVAVLKRALPKTGIHNVYISIALNLIVSTTVPLLFSMLCKKINIHGLFFKPVTYVTKALRRDDGIQDG